MPKSPGAGRDRPLRVGTAFIGMRLNPVARHPTFYMARKAAEAHGDLPIFTAVATLMAHGESHRLFLAWAAKRHSPHLKPPATAACRPYANRASIRVGLFKIGVALQATFVEVHQQG